MLRPLLNLSMSYLFVFFSLLPLEKHKKKLDKFHIVDQKPVPDKPRLASFFFFVYHVLLSLR